MQDYLFFNKVAGLLLTGLQAYGCRLLLNTFLFITLTSGAKSCPQPWLFSDYI